MCTNKSSSTVGIIVSRAFVKSFPVSWPQNAHLPIVKAAEIENGLDKCLSDLDAAMNLLSFSNEDNANIIIRNEREIQKSIRTNTSAMNDLLHQILTSQKEMKRIYQMQVNGEHVAERIMEAGQIVSSIIYIYLFFWNHGEIRNYENYERMRRGENVSRGLFPERPLNPLRLEEVSTIGTTSAD